MKKFKTIVRDQVEQSGADKLGEEVITLNRDNDLAGIYVEELRHKKLQNELKLQNIEISEREQALTERRNREHTTHLMNIQSIEHTRFGYDRLNNLEPREAKAISEVLSGVQIEAIKSLIVESIKEVMDSRLNK